MIPGRDRPVFRPFVNPFGIGVQAGAKCLQILGQAGAGGPQVDKIADVRNGFHVRLILGIFSRCQSPKNEALEISPILRLLGA